MKWIAFNPDWENLPEPKPSAFANPPLTAPKPSEPLPKCKVVVAEDDLVSREVISALLRKWGFEVFVTNDGNEALEALRAQQDPVLAVLDWMMPGRDGIEVCRRVREMEKLVYVLLLTARSAKEHLLEGFAAGADDYLTKPFNKEELHARLKAGLRVLMLQATLATRVAELESAQLENRELRMQLPL